MKHRGKKWMRGCALFGVLVLVCQMFANCLPVNVSAQSSSIASMTTGCTIPDIATSNASAATLSTSGRSLPKTSYAIPAQAIYMDNDTGASDKNPGTRAQPVKSLSHALDIVPACGTIVVRAGRYRDWYHDPSQPDVPGRILTKSVTIQAYPGESVWFDGTNIVSKGWHYDASQKAYWVAWNATRRFCGGNYFARPILEQDIGPNNAGPCYHADLKGRVSGSGKNPMAGDPMMVFRTAKTKGATPSNLYETTSIAGVRSNSDSFYYQVDRSARTGKVWVGFSPASYTMELTARPQLLVVDSHTVLHLLGIGVTRYASSEYDGTASAALYVATSSAATQGHTIIENSVFADNAASGLRAPAAGVVARSAFIRNGYDGIIGNGHNSNSPAIYDGLIIKHSLFDGNNRERFGYNCTRSCGQSAVKLSNMNGYQIIHNIVRNTKGTGTGLWCDLNCANGLFAWNNVQKNGKHGIYSEASDSTTIVSNLVVANGEDGIKMSSNGTIAFNTIAVGKGAGINIYDDKRARHNAIYTLGPHLTNVQIYDNVISGKSTRLQMTRRIINDEATGPDIYLKSLDYNSYSYYPGVAKNYLVDWVDARGGVLTSIDARTLTELRSQHQNLRLTLETHGQALDATKSDPFFVAASKGDYRIRATSKAYHSAGILPASLAATLKVSTADGKSRGAITWEGK